MRLATAGIAAALIVLLSGCTEPAPAPTTATPSLSPSPAESDAVAPLSCEELVPASAAATALAGSEGPGTAVESPMPVWDLYEWSVMAAGGVSCDWHVGDSATYLVVDVLPGAAEAWHGHDYGDGTIEPNRTVAGVPAAAACGMAGCMISAPVAGAWTMIGLRTDGSRAEGFRSDGTRFKDLSDEEALAGLDAAAGSVFSALATADPERLDWSRGGATSAASAACDDVLPAAEFAEITGYPVVWEVPQLTDRELAFFRATAQARAGFLTCNAPTPEGPFASVVVAPGAAWLVSEFASLADAPEGGSVIAVGGSPALQWCSPNGGWCTVLVAVGDDAVQVSDSTHAVEMAEAVVARTR